MTLQTKNNKVSDGGSVFLFLLLGRRRGYGNGYSDAH